MPDISSKKFAAVFAQALTDSGRLTRAEVKKLQAAQAGIGNAKERAAAKQILALVEHDGEFDGFELGPIREALGVLLGATAGPLPKDLEAVLRHAVPQANVQVKHYDLTFDLTVKNDRFPARAVILLDRPAPNDAVLEVNPDRLTIEAVRAEGQGVPFEVRDGRLHVTAPGAKQLQVDYAVTPDDSQSPDAFGLIRDKYTGRMWTMTWPYNTGALFPSNSDPADGATSSVVVKVAKGLVAVGTGYAKKGAFCTEAESPAYAIAFYAASDFQLGDAGKGRAGVDVSSYGDAHIVSEENRKAYRETAKAALDFYSEWLGKFDYGPTLKLIELKGGLGGMEHTAAVAIMLNAARNKDDAKETAAHETAHHWFGDNLRIASWGDFWMSEGFTNYATYRYFRAAEGEDKYVSLLENARAELDAALRENPHALSAPEYTDVNEIFDSVPYQLGPWMLRMMEVALGTDAFDALLRSWYQAKRHQAVSTDEFVEFAKKKTGHDYGPFFARWNALTAVPRLESSVKVKGDTVDVALTAKNEVPDGLEVPLVLEGAREVKTVMVKPGQSVRLDPGFKVLSTRWDPDCTVLAYVK